MTRARTPAGLQPPRWPSNVQYLAEPSYHSSVSPEIRSEIRPSNGSRSLPSLNRPLVQLVTIRQIVDSSHPARGQYGLFATKKVSPRTLLLDYIGEVHCDDRPESDYDISLHRTQNGVSVGVDARWMGNEARFINDFRGVRSKPNAVFEERRTAAGELRMCVWTGSEAIKKGDEILVSYGKAWWNARSGGEDRVHGEVLKQE
ncbi:hypothetical protein B0H21DRAFT_694110 [Amylocystis lapponica]|nr:hypothetical protein B0H21DRAFT_694110 [Amylocystis lapponica]